MLLCILISISSAVFSQIRGVNGTVRSSANEPIGGAVVSVMGSEQRSLTNERGEFTVQASPGDSLEVSSLNYMPHIFVLGNQTTIAITMNESAGGELDEVVVIGYGRTTRKNLTTAQTTIRAEDIQRTVNTTFDQALQGRAAGVVVVSNSGQPGGSFSVNIRGVSTINGTQEPLYVIDGVQIQPSLSGFGATSSANPLAALNPNDIENMEVLQGPNATAIYGTRASNGVILITTKRGKSGRPKISYDFLYSLQQQPEFIPMLNLREWAVVSNELRRAYGQGIPAEYQDSSILGEGTNWQEEIFRNAPLRKHQASISGGTDATKYYLSVENLQHQGVVFGSQFNRTGVRLNLDNNISKWLTLGLNVAASQTDEELSTTQNEVIKLAMQIPPYIPVRNPDGSWGGYPEGLQPELSLQNPIALADLITNSNQRRQLLGGVNATLRLLPGLEFRTSLNTTIDAGKTLNWTPTYELGARTNSQASLSKGYSDNFYWNWTQLLEYRKTFNEKHNFSAMVGHEAQEGRWEGLSGNRQVFPLNQLPGGFLPVLSMGNEQGMSNGDYKGWFALESYLGRLTYNYKEKYFANLSMRRDGHTFFSD
ncbi:MAG: SusC/RagA family TonB-linked outer membrane protein, partial [Gallicola sp.]|nr:SusC/RagA family TonB-linked outer membrane protein [Gallicola sp.]